MVIYGFDEVDDQLDLVPMAARRALDRAGLRLPLEGWRSLHVEARRAIAEAGSGVVVDVTPVIAATATAHPAPSAIEPVSDPPVDAVPAEVAAELGGDREIPAPTWAALTPLGRYALAKIARRGRPERVAVAYDEIVGKSALSTHVDASGSARMVDVGEKPATHRRAVAESRVTMSAEAFERLRRADSPKGDVLGSARLAGIMAAKRTAELIPLCHPLALSQVRIELVPEAADCAVRITAAVEAVDRTGVEMEALTAASVAALTVYDMLKAFDRRMVVGPTQLLEKSGGRSGAWRR